MIKKTGDSRSHHPVLKIKYHFGTGIHHKDTKNMENEQEEDIITIHLGKVLTEKQYDAIVKSVIDFLNTNWSHLLKIQS